MESADDRGISDWSAKASQIENNIDSVTGITVSGFSYTLISYGGTNISTGVRGLDLATADAMYGIGDSLLNGTMPASNGEVLVGSVLNDELNIPLNATLQVTNWDQTITNLTVTGIYEFGAAIADNQMIVNLETCQAIFNMGESVDAIEIQVGEVFTADTVALDVAAVLNDDSLEISNWKETSKDLLDALQSQSLSSYMIQGFVLISVVIAIASVLAITVLQKSRQIGILKAMGIKDRTASLIFLYQGLLLGIMGAIGGVLIGLFLLYGFIFGTTSGGQESVITLIIDFKFIALSGAIAVISAMVASVLPARRSSKLSPAEVIRNG